MRLVDRVEAVGAQELADAPQRVVGHVEHLIEESRVDDNAATGELARRLIDAPVDVLDRVRDVCGQR